MVPNYAVPQISSKSTRNGRCFASIVRPSLPATVFSSMMESSAARYSSLSEAGGVSCRLHHSFVLCTQNSA